MARFLKRGCRKKTRKRDGERISVSAETLEIDSSVFVGRSPCSLFAFCFEVELGAQDEGRQEQLRGWIFARPGGQAEADGVGEEEDETEEERCDSLRACF